MKKNDNNGVSNTSRSSIGKKVAVVGAVVVGAVSQAQAAITAPSFDSADAITVGGAVLIGLAAIWGIKKALQMAR